MEPRQGHFQLAMSGLGLDAHGNNYNNAVRRSRIVVENFVGVSARTPTDPAIHKVIHGQGGCECVEIIDYSKSTTFRRQFVYTK
jgi:hypothetical protein